MLEGRQTHIQTHKQRETQTNTQTCSLQYFTTAPASKVIIIIIITSIQCNFEKGHMTILSALPRGYEWICPISISQYTVRLTHESAPKRHLNHFSRFCTAHTCSQHRQTDHAMCDICSRNCTRCSLIINNKISPVQGLTVDSSQLTFVPTSK